MTDSYIIWAKTKALLGDNKAAQKMIQDGVDEMVRGINDINLNHHANDLPLLVAACRIAAEALTANLSDEERDVVNMILKGAVAITIPLTKN